MGPEAKFYKYFKSKTPEIIYTRIENTSSLGVPMHCVTTLISSILQLSLR